MLAFGMVGVLIGWVAALPLCLVIYSALLVRHSTIGA